MWRLRSRIRLLIHWCMMPPGPDILQCVFIHLLVRLCLRKLTHRLQRTRIHFRGNSNYPLDSSALSRRSFPHFHVIPSLRLLILASRQHQALILIHILSGLLQRVWEFLKRPCPIEMFIPRLTLRNSTENWMETEHIRPFVVETALMCNLIVGGSIISSYNAFV